jgi:prepilin-type N-terminal cleavage/methylation domain-containing protein
MKIKNVYLQSGFSLIEVMVVLVMLAILTTIAIMSFGNSKTDLQRQRIAREFKVYLERARFNSVKRRVVDVNEMSRVTLNSPSSFTAAIDLDENGVLDSTDIRQVDFDQRSDKPIVFSNALNYPVTIRFNQRGQTIVKDNLGNDVNPLFTICSKNCSDPLVVNRDLTIISISTSGTVAVLKNGQSPSPLPTPSITNTSPEFNCYVSLVNTNSSPCLVN